MMGHILIIGMWLVFTYNAVFDKRGTDRGFMGRTSWIDRGFSVAGALFFSYLMVKVYIL